MSHFLADDLGICFSLQVFWIEKCLEICSKLLRLLTQNMSIINIIMVQVLLGLMLKWYYVQMTLQCYVFVEDWMSSNRGGARKKLWKLLFAEFFDYSIFVYISSVGKEWNKCCGEKKLKFLLWFVHICWIIWLCF